ncbi:MAG: COG2426 family protein [Minisyncoccia bacterium]
MSKELITIFIALSPFSELRGAIPVAIGIFHFSWPKALILSIFGNIIFIIPLMWFLEKFSDFLMQKSIFWENFFNWLFQRTRNKIDTNYKKYSHWALTIFVAIPLPMTGAWTGSVAAYLLGLNKKEAFVYISLGVVIAGIIVTLLTLLGKKVI